MLLFAADDAAAATKDAEETEDADEEATDPEEAEEPEEAKARCAMRETDSVSQGQDLQERGAPRQVLLRQAPEDNRRPRVSRLRRPRL